MSETRLKLSVPHKLIVNPAVYPKFVVKKKTVLGFFPFKSGPIQLRISITKLRPFPWFSRVPQSKFKENQSRYP